MDSGEHATDPQDADEFLRQAQALEIGAWVEFLSEENKTLNARLSWKSCISRKYVFANRLGHILREVTLHGLATELRSGRAKLIQSYSLFDRAVDTLISKITH